MDPAQLEGLGLTTRQQGGSLEAILDLQSLPLLNPITRSFVDRVVFTLVGERLFPLEPPEVVGLAPIPVSALQRAADAEKLLHDAFNEHVFQVQRRSTELTALGLSPRVDPASVQLSARVQEGSVSFTIASDRRGHFRVERATRDGVELRVPTLSTFELSEFRDRSALAGYLVALFAEGEALPGPGGEGPAAAAPAEAPAPPVVRFAELERAFGGAALVPPASTLELLVELQVEGTRYRFAAARVAGRTFRGLLAGNQGKLWAGRFELDTFAGVVALAAEVLQVPAGAVQLLGPASSGE